MLHGRMAPIRAVEYHIPVFGVWSSGISQLTDSSGQVIATAGYPGQGEILAGPFEMTTAGRVPPDRMVAMGCVVVTAVLVVCLCILPRRRWPGVLTAATP
jgi:apolipoprotein N-acyltransferase